MAATLKQITVEVVYANASQQQSISVVLDEGSTLETAIDRSGILIIFPEIDLTQQPVGVFGQPKKLTDRVYEGARIEIYRPLLMDPKEARKRRAKS